MRVEQLEELVVISRCQSLSVASEQLHISVQALSASIKNLETEMNMVLLERHAKGITMTKDGLAVVEVAKRFLADMYKLQFKHEDPRILALARPMTIYTQLHLYELFLPKMFCELRQQIPGTELNFKKYTRQQPLIDAIMQGDTEFAFTFYDTKDQEGYRYQKELNFMPLFECKLVCLAHHSFPLASLRTISLKKVLDYPLVIYRPQDQTENDMLRLLHSFGEAQNLIVADDFFIYREMIAAGVGLGFSVLTPFESHHRPYSDQVETIIINDAIQLCGGYIVKKDAVLSEISDVFLRYTKNHLIRTGKAYPAYIF